MTRDVVEGRCPRRAGLTRASAPPAGPAAAARRRTMKTSQSVVQDHLSRVQPRPPADDRVVEVQVLGASPSGGISVTKRGRNVGSSIRMFASPAEGAVGQAAAQVLHDRPPEVVHRPLVIDDAAFARLDDQKAHDTEGVLASLERVG